jgi:DNA repair exonuclease SbcCD ATPase subunit
MSTEQLQEGVRVDVENVGGIDEASVSFIPGVTILAGRNATNRTSLLQALMAGLGSDDVSLKSDADEGFVELEIGEETYSRRLTRTDGSISSDGEPYLEDTTLPDLFAFLLESNEARRAVARGDDLRDLIMRPIDTDEINAEIERLVERRRRIERDLDEIDALKEELPGLEERRTELQGDVADKQDALEETEAEIESLDVDVDDRRNEKDEVEAKLSELQELRSTLDDVRFDLETEQESLEALRTECSDLEAELSELPDAPMGELEEIEAEIDRLRSKKQRAESAVNELQSIIRFNEEMLEDETDVPAELLENDDADSITDQLVEDDMVQCWTCGSAVDAEQIEATVDRLRELSQDKLATVRGTDDDLEELKAEARTYQQQQRRREEIDRKLQQIEDDIERGEATIEELRERRDGLTEEISNLESEVDELETETDDEVLELHKEANQLEYELGKLDGQLEDVEAEIAGIEDRLEERDDLEAERDDVQSRIEELRTRIERIERQAVEEFNDHMDIVLDLLDYENLDRIWLERTETQVREGRRTVTKSVFDLHVVRSTASGTTYEDTIDNLSESEREVTGLIFALAGYLAHEVYEDLPFILLDSLEAIDAERIATLVEYLEEYSEYLVVALLEEDAEALDEEYARIRDLSAA